MSRSLAGLFIASTATIAVAMAMLLFLLGSDGAGGEVDPAMGKVAYVIDGNIWVRELPDGPPRQITDSGGDLSPQWSASGEWLSFYRETPPGGRGETWVMRADGSDARGLRESLLVNWAPHDDVFVYRDGEGDIVLERPEDPDGRIVLLAAPSESGDINPSAMINWSPDGEWIALRDLFPRPVFTDERLYRIYRLSTQGGELEEFFREAGDPFGTEPEDQTLLTLRLLGWTPDGDHFLITRSVESSVEQRRRMEAMTTPGADVPPEPGLDLLVVDIESGEVNETGAFTRNFGEQLRPYGANVLFVAGTALNSWQDARVALLEPGTGEVVYLTEAGEAAIQPDWSPDGDRIAYASGPVSPDAQLGSTEATTALSERRLWVMDADGGNKEMLTDDPRARDEHPQWTAGGQHVLFVRIGLEAPTMDIDLMLLDLETGEVKTVATGLHPSHERARGYSFDLRELGHSGDWAQYFSYWRR